MAMGRTRARPASRQHSVIFQGGYSRGGTTVLIGPESTATLKAILSCISLLCVVGFLAPAEAGPINIHLTWQHDPSNTVTVSWATSTDAPSVVEYGLDQAYGSRVEGATGTLHHVELAGLQPNTFYHYRCGTDSDWSQDLTFKTGPGDPSQAFTFVALGDSRTNWDVWGRCAEAVSAVRPDFVLHTGDLVENGGDQNQWNIWFDKGRDLLANIVMMPTIGNHEGNHPRYYEQFALPHVEDWYHFDYGNARFIALTTEKSMTGAQKEWLESCLASSTATWNFVFYHRPMYSSGGHGVSQQVIDAWGDVLDRYHVDMVFNGHDHLYERCHPMFDNWVAESPETGTIHIVTGGAGAPLGSLVALGPWSAHFLRDYHFVVITVNGTELTMEARLLNQSVFDVLSISKAESPDLVPESIQTAATYPLPGAPTSIAGSVANKGRSQSAECGVGLIIDGEVVATKTLGPLSPGAASIVEFDWTPPMAGVYNVTILVDLDDVVTEGIREDNNVISTSLLVAESKPDLVVRQLDLSSALLRSGERIEIRVEVQNIGSAPAGPFDLEILVGSTTLAVTRSSGMGPGQIADFSVWWTPQGGDWMVAAAADSGGTVDEVFESNNRLERKAQVRDLQKVGPAYLPQGFKEDEALVVYYHGVDGEIPMDSPSCVVVWGINGWKRPPSTAVPPNTMQGAAFQTVMERVSDGLWFVSLPTSPDMECINLKFQDRQALPRYRDTNDGSGWTVPSGGFTRAQLAELAAAIEAAERSGLNVSAYREIAAAANLSISSERYVEALVAIQSALDSCRLEECKTLLNKASLEYQRALAEGIAVSRAETLLTAATKQMEGGNYAGAKNYIGMVLDLIKEARSGVPEAGLAAVLMLGSFLGMATMARRRMRDQEH